MKTYFYSLMMVASFATTAQQTGPLFKPTKISYYYEPLGGWNLETVRKFKYDTQGNAVLILTEAGDGTPVRKDSNIYSATSQLLEIHRFYWAASQNQHLPDEKIITSYDATGRIIKSLSYLWFGSWHLVTGAEHFISYDAASRTETDIAKVYDEEAVSWKNQGKTVTKFNAQGQKDSIIIYTTDASQDFVPFSRQGFAGWHNYEKEIEKGQTLEKYMNGSWQMESSSTTKKQGSLWVKTELRPVGPTAGTYKILFEDDGSFRELMKQNNPGWLSLSTFSRNGNIDKIVQNGFEGDILKTTETDEKEIDDQGNLIRTTERIHDGTQQTTSFSEFLTAIQYDSRQLPLEAITKVTNDASRSTYALFEKVVYADYVDVRLTTALENSAASLANAQVRVYPNPSSGRFNITSSVFVSSINVYGNEGQLLRNISTQGGNVDLTDLPAGIYHLQFHTEHGVSRQKVVITAP